MTAYLKEIWVILQQVLYYFEPTFLLSSPILSNQKGGGFMLKVEHSTDYLTKGRCSSEKFEGAQTNVKQITSQRKTLRFKRSDDNPELPENFKVGQAIGSGDCFFDSVAKGLKQLKPEMDFTVKSLREVCKRFAQNQLENDQSWLKGALRSEAEPISVYVPRIEFTANDIEQKSGSVNVLGLTVPIWGRSEIEGRIICKEYNVKLHVVEKHVVEGKEVWLDQIVNSEGSRSMDSMHYYNEKNTIHIINRGNAHFEPILSTQEIQHNKRQSPDPSDYDDEIIPEVELINIIKSRDSEEEKLTKIRKLFEKEPKPDINFQGEDKHTPLHIAIRKKELKVIEWLVKKGAKIDIKNSRGRTQLEVAQHIERQDIVEVLKSHIQPNLQVSVERPSTQRKKTRTDSKEDKSEDSSHKRPRTSLQAAEESRGRKRTQNGENELGAGQVKKLKTSEGYPALGLKSSLHGTVYQLKLLMLFLKRGLDQGYSFDLATEMDAAEKFDDVVFQYTEGGEEVYRFLQAKHKQDDNKKITVNNLLTEQDDEFSLQKYFISYRKIKQNPEFKGYKLKDFVICTNIDLEENLRNSFEPVEGEDNILRLNSEKSERLKLKVDRFPNEKDLVSILKKTSELNRLAKKLAKCVLENDPLDLKDNLFRSYHGVLGETVIDVKNVEQREEKDNKGKEIKKSYAKFRSNFLDGSSQELENFRSALLKAYQEMSKEQMNVNEFWQKMKARELQISQTFGKVFELDTNPQLTNSEVFAKAIANAMSVAKQDVVNIKREKRKGIIKDNIDKLAGHILIKKGDKEKDTYYFSSTFFDDNNKLPGNLESFKKELKAELESKIMEFDKDKYKFHIANFKTCEEEQLHLKTFLPDDYIDEEEIESFFEKLVFAINQPNEIELGDIIKAEMGEDKDINLIDSELIASKFQEDMLNWMKEKKGRFFTHEDGKAFLKEAKQKISKLVLIGPTLEYRAKIEDFGIAFSEEPSGLSNFLASHERQIFNLISPYKTMLSSIKVYQTLKDIPEYQKDDSHIFVRLSSLLRMKNRVIKAFESGTPNNLLVIECKAAEENVDELCHQLSKVTRSSANKKIILITQENDPLANKFKHDFLESNRYEEKIDEKNSLTDLTNESQQKLVKEGKVILQGEEVSLGTLVDDGSKHLIDGEVLSKLINHEKIEVGKAPIDSKYEDIKDYYIPRTFDRQVKIKEDLKKKESEFLVTYNSQIDEQSLKKNQDIVLISATDNGFKELYNKYKERNIHWFKQEVDDLIWQQSYGILSKLRDFIDTNEQPVQEYKPEKITDIKDRVVIISAEPGMGKSTVLNPLALRTKDSLWVIRINLLDYSTELMREKKKKTKLNEAEAIRFLYRIIGFQLFQGEKEETTEEKKQRVEMIENVVSSITVEEGKIGLGDYRERIQGLNLLEIGLFNNFYNQARIALLFDGFDEISPDYAEKVIELMQVLKNTKIEKLWITTRRYNVVQEKLEDQLSVFSYSLKPLLPEEQKAFLRKFWKAKLKLGKLDGQRSGVFINELLDRIHKSTGDQVFMSMPLHALMVAEIFEDPFEGFYASNKQKLSDEHKKKIEEQDLATLYERFIVKKFYKIRFGEKKPGMNIDDPDMNGLIMEKYNEFEEDHMKLALYGIFNKDEVEKLLSQEEIEEVTKLIDKIKQGKEKSGIIERVIDSKPEFVHRTFAEYFVASYFWKSFKSVKFDKFEDFVENIIVKNLIKDDRIQISNFLQLKAKKDLESNVDFSDKQGKLKTLLTKLLDQTEKYGPIEDTKQSTKLLFGIIEFSLSIEEGSNSKVIENIEDSNQQLKLLCVSAEMGYIKLANALAEMLDTEFLQKYLKDDKWRFSPLWLAAKRGYLDVVRIIVKKLSYDTNWKDKDQKTLVQRIFQHGEYDLLRSCLKLDIVDGKPYEGLYHEQALPIVETLNSRVSSDVIKLLIKKTDSDLVNKFDYNQHPAVYQIILKLLKYDKEITELAIKEGIDFSHVINVLLFEFREDSLGSPNKILNDRISAPIYSDKEFLNLFERIELLLKAGAGYNYKDTEYKQTTLQYAEQIHYIHKLLDGVHKLHSQKNDKSSNPVDTILKLIIDSMSRSSDFRGYKIIIEPEKICLRPIYGDESLEFGRNNEEISLLSKRSSLFEKLFFKFYHDNNTDLVKILGELSSYISNAKEEIEEFKKFPDSRFLGIFQGYELMLKYKTFTNIEEKERQYKSLNKFEKDLLKRVLHLYIKQDYEIDKALKEVSEEVLKFEKIINRLPGNKNLGRKENVYKTDEILNIFDIKGMDTDKELQDLISKIYECGGIQLLSDTWSELKNIGQQRRMEALELMFKFADQSSKIFELLKELNDSYRSLTKAIKNKNYQEINNILQSKEPNFIKAVINGRDDEYGSPLHYAAFKGDVQVTKILLESGANPNLKMQESDISLSTADETQIDEDLEYDYEGWTPLHLAVLKDQLEVAEILVNCGADVNAMIAWQGTPLHMAAFSGKLNLIKFLVEKGADVNAKGERGRTPLHIAAYSGKLDVVKFLVEERKADPNTQDKDGKTPLDLAYKRLDQDRQNDNFKAIKKLLLNSKDKSQHREEQRSISLEECLPSTSSGRSKREVKIGECELSWEDVDEFNEEKDEKRDFSKIKINSKKFISYLKDLPEEKQSKLIQLADETGSPQGLVSKLTSNQKVITHLNRVGRVSGMTMHGMMAKNVLADFLNGDYQGVAINVGFIAGGQGFAKVSEVASIKGLKLASEGKLLLGKSLRAASPFLARGTSAFVIYDLVNQIKAFKNGTEEALVGVVGDSIYLVVDAAEIGIEIAEAFEVLEGVLSVTGPIGATIGAVVFVGTDVYMAVKRVDKINEVIPLTGKERFVEGLRAFIGMQPENHIQELLHKKEVSNELVRQGLEYLNGHSDIQSYVFPTGKSIVDSCRKVPYQVSDCASGGFGGGCLRASTVTRYAEECTTKFEIDLDSTVLLDRKRADIKWSRARPDNPSNGKLFCLPQGNDKSAPSYGSYLCENAIGLSTNKTGNHTLVSLGEGKDYAKGFLNSPNIFVVNNGSKEYYGGSKDDVFVLQGDYIKGHLSGQGGINTLDATSFAFQEEPLSIQLHIGEIADYYRDNWLKVCEINKMIGRENKAETITVSCDGCNSNVKLIDGQSGNEKVKDEIKIIDDSCSYQMQIIVRPNTVIYNRALKGSFDYVVPLNGSGSAELSFIYGPERFNVNNTLWFAYEPANIKSIDVKYVNVFNRTEHEVKFNFVESEKEFNLTICYPQNPSYRLGNNGEIRIGNKDNLYLLQNSNESAEEIIKNYLPIANRLNKMSFFIQLPLSNETVAIGSGNYEVIHNNPLQKSHLVGFVGENVYVIDSESKRFEIPLPEVVIYDLDVENSVDTIDLKNLVQQAKDKFSNSFELQVLKSANDLLLKATVTEVKPTEDLPVNKIIKHECFTVRLKDGINWYNKTHVIMDNVPMRINLDNNEWRLKPLPLVFEKDKEVIIITSQDIGENTELITPKKAGNYRFVRDNGTDLMITNAFDANVTRDNFCTIVLSKFYETPKMETLSIKFADKEVVLKEHQGEISKAKYLSSIKKEHQDKVYKEVFGSKNMTPEVVMLSDQPVTHRHRHEHHIRNRRSEYTISSGTRPSSWVNGLFSWIKGSVVGLFGSSTTLLEEPITQNLPKESFYADEPRTTILEMGDHYLSHVDFNGTIMLLDLLIRKVTGQKYISAVDQSIGLSPLEAQGYALNITKEFEKVVEQAGLKSGVSMHRLNIDFWGIQEVVTGKIMGSKFNEIPEILNSYVEKTLPSRRTGDSGRLSPKKFDKFMVEFNKGLDVTLNQSMQQILNTRNSTLEVNDVKERQINSDPKSYLSNTSVQGYLIQDRGLRIR